MARTIIKHDFRNISGGTAKQNLAGPVIGEIGSLLTETDIPELAEPLKNKPHGLAELNEQFKPATFDIQAESFAPEALPEIGQLPPKRVPSIQKPPAGESGTGNPYGPQNNPHSFLFVNTPQEEKPEASPFQLRQFGNVGALTPNGNNLGGGPLKRNSPLKRASAVRFKQEEATQAKGPGYLGASKTIRGSANAGYNAVVDRHNYKREVWAQKAAEADEEMGKLQVEQSGVSSWDASVENMAREWKGELGDLLKNKESIDPNEFVQRKQDILARSAQFSKASQSLQKVVADYNENLDNISTSTDPETLDLLNTLNKGGGSIGVSNINGVPTLAGLTIGGQQVSVPISEIASGRNAFRFNTQTDITGGLNKISDGLGKLKRDIATRSGRSSQALGWDEIKDSAAGQIDGMLNSNAAVKSILADKYGYDYDDYREMFGQDGDAAREFAKEQLMSTLETQHAPYQAATQIEKQFTPKSPAGSAVDARSQKDASFIVGQLNNLENVDIDSIQSFKGLGRINDVAEADGALGVKVGNNWYELSPDPETAKQQLAQYAGVDARHLNELQQPSPVNRSPLKRFADWASTPFKKYRPPNKNEFNKALIDAQGGNNDLLSKYGYNSEDVSQLQNLLNNSGSTSQFDKIRNKGHIPGTPSSHPEEKKRLGEWWNHIKNETGVELTKRELESNIDGPRGALKNAQQQVSRQQQGSSKRTNSAKSGYRGASGAIRGAATRKN